MSSFLLILAGALVIRACSLINRRKDAEAMSLIRLAGIAVIAAWWIA